MLGNISHLIAFDQYAQLLHSMAQQDHALSNLDSAVQNHKNYARLGAIGTNLFAYPKELSPLLDLLDDSSVVYKNLLDTQLLVRRLRLSNDVTFGDCRALIENQIMPQVRQARESVERLLGRARQPNLWANSSALQRGLRYERWTVAEFTRQRATATFAEKLLKTAIASTDTRTIAYAAGYLSHYAAAVPGSGYVNAVVGGPPRTRSWRSRMAGNVIDTSLWDAVRHDDLLGSNLTGLIAFSNQRIPGHLSSLIQKTLDSLYSQHFRTQIDLDESYTRLLRHFEIIARFKEPPIPLNLPAYILVDPGSFNLIIGPGQAPADQSGGNGVNPCGLFVVLILTVLGLLAELLLNILAWLLYFLGQKDASSTLKDWSAWIGDRLEALWGIDSGPAPEGQSAGGYALQQLSDALRGGHVRPEYQQSVAAILQKGGELEVLAFKAELVLYLCAMQVQSVCCYTGFLPPRRYELTGDFMSSFIVAPGTDLKFPRRPINAAYPQELHYPSTPSERPTKSSGPYAHFPVSCLLGGGAPNYTFAYAFHSVLERLAQDKPLADPKGGEFNLDSDRQMGDYCWKLANRTRITDDPLNVRYLATGALD